MVGLVISFVFFFMVEVAYAVTLKEWLLTISGVEETVNSAMVVMVGGQLIIIVVNVVSSLLISGKKYERRTVVTAIVLASLLNALLWFFFPFFYVVAVDPGLLGYSSDMTITQTIGLIVLTPRSIAIFTLIYLPSPVYYWFLGIATYFVFYLLALKRYAMLKGRRRNNRYQKNYPI
jgi:hypothetical protein